MSAGAFGIANYFTDKGGVCRIRIQPETLGCTVGGETNSNIAGTVDQEASAIASSGRGNGVFARRVNLVFTGAAPTGYAANARVSVPWLVKSSYDNITKGDEGTYLGATVRVTGKTNERIG